MHLAIKLEIWQSFAKALFYPHLLASGTGENKTNWWNWDRKTSTLRRIAFATHQLRNHSFMPSSSMRQSFFFLAFHRTDMGIPVALESFCDFFIPARWHQRHSFQPLVSSTRLLFKNGDASVLQLDIFANHPRRAISNSVLKHLILV